MLRPLDPRYTKPGLQAEKTELTNAKRINYNDDGLPSSWKQYNQSVRHRYILFVFMVCSVFFRLHSGLSISSASGCIPLPPLVGLMDPNRFKNVSICFIIAIQITKPLSIPQQTIFLLLHMVINHEITIFDFSRFLFATLTFWVVKSRRGSNGPVYPIKRRGFFACYRVQRTHAWRKRV